MAYKYAGNKYDYEYTDTYCGEANYSWVKRGSITMPELTHYGYDGLRGYGQANKIMERELVKKVKAELGLTGVRCKRSDCADTIELRPCGSNTVVFITFSEDSE